MACAALWPGAAQAAADLYIKDCPADTGAEPDTVCAVVYLSEDIWVRQNPISGYQFAPFVADPAWLTAVSPLHQNPDVSRSEIEPAELRLCGGAEQGQFGVEGHGAVAGVLGEGLDRAERAGSMGGLRGE